MDLQARIHRRHFLFAVGSSTSGLLAGGLPAAAQTKPTSSELIQGKDGRLKVHSDKPVVLETPLSLLADPRITPKEILFIRNNVELPEAATIKSLPMPGWKIDLGSLGKPAAVSVEELAKSDQVEHEMVLQCSGNGRFLFNEAAPVRGTPWGKGGVGNVTFKGVPLAVVFKKWHIDIDPSARFLTARGKAPAKGGAFEHSIPLDEALTKSFLALEMNGEPLAAAHGGPVRLITPGYYGTMQVKWLTHLWLDRNESANAYQLLQYRTPMQPIKPGEKLEFTFQNSRPSWRMKIVSFIFCPEPKSVLKPGQITFRGVAFNDGAARIESVLVSVDRGKSWTKANLETPTSKFAWYPWKIQLVLQSGMDQAWVRAVDVLGRTQPLDGNIYWNPNGYEWNGVDKVDFVVK